MHKEIRVLTAISSLHVKQTTVFDIYRPYPHTVPRRDGVKHYVDLLCHIVPFLEPEFKYNED